MGAEGVSRLCMKGGATAQQTKWGGVVRGVSQEDQQPPQAPPTFGGLPVTAPTDRSIAASYLKCPATTMEQRAASRAGSAQPPPRSSA